MIRLLSIIFFLCSALVVESKDSIVTGLSSKNIHINTTFTGSEILLFGSIKRSEKEEIIPSDIIIEVLGPKSDIILLQKKKILGIWVNSNPIKIYGSPSFYSLLYTENPKTILTKDELRRTAIGVEKFFLSNKQSPIYQDAVNAKIRIKIKEGSYILNNNKINIKNKTLFSTKISLPANLTEGDYSTTIYLVQNGKVINHSTDIVKVRKIGLERWLYTTAQQNPFFYGMFSIFLALFFGWGASSLFKKF